MDETRLGAILLESRVIAEADLEKCLEIQALTGGSRHLGHILVEQGLIDRSTLERVLDMQQSRLTQQRQLLQTEGVLHDRFLRAAVAAGANELVISEGRPPLVRVGGELRELGTEELRGPEVWDFVRAEMGHEVLEELADKCFVTRDLAKPGLCRGRITAFRQFDGVAVIVRLHPEVVRRPEELGIPARVLEIIRSGKGLVLLAGERGSGRTELMASLVHEVATEEGRYVLVLDDSREYPVPQSGSLVARRRVGEHVSDYVTALKTAVREDPDAILIGDVGEGEAFDLAIRAAEGGRLVLASLHAGSVVAAMHRVLNFYPTYDVARLRATLASVLRCVLVGHLLPKTTKDGLVSASELLIVDDAARDVLRNGDLSHLNLLMRMAGSKSGHSLDQSLLDLLTSGQVCFEDVFLRADEKAWLLEQTKATRSLEV
jgi:twitching motility protein PilT